MEGEPHMVLVDIIIVIISKPQLIQRIGSQFYIKNIEACLGLSLELELRNKSGVLDWVPDNRVSTALVVYSNTVDTGN